MSGPDERAENQRPERQQYALNAAMYQLIKARMWDELLQLFATAGFIAERSEQSGFADIYNDALAATKSSATSSEWQQGFAAWEYFLRRRIERLRLVPRAYAQEVVNEFLPVAPQIVAARLSRLGEHLHESAEFYLKKTSGPPALGLAQTGIVYGMAFSPDQRLAICGSDERALRIWDIRSGELQAECVGHADVVGCVAFSPDGRLAASGSHDRTVKVWDVSTGRLIATCSGHRDWVNAVVFSEDGRRVASADAAVMVWEAETGSLVAEMAGHDNAVADLSFSADGGRLASGGLDAMVRVWETATGRLVAECPGRSNFVASVRFFHDGKRLASGDTDGMVKVWEAESGQLVLECVGGDTGITSLAVSPDDELIASAAGEAGVRVWTASGQLLNEYLGHGEKILAVSFAADGTLAANSVSTLYTARPLASVAPETAGERVIRVWDRESLRLLAECTGAPGRPLGLLFSGDGRSVVSVRDERAVSVWSLPPGQLTGDCRGLGAGATCAAASQDGGLVAAGSEDGGVRAWSVPPGRLTADCRGLSAPVTCVAVSQDGGQVAAGDGAGLVMVWDASTGRETCRCTGHAGAVIGIAFAPDGQTIASGGDDKTVREWRADTGELVTEWRRDIDQVRSVEFGPDGITVVTPLRDTGTFSSFKTVISGQLHSLTVEARLVHPPGHAATSPDGTLIAASDRLLEPWAARRPARLAVGAERADGIKAVAFSGDGRLVAWGHTDVAVLDRAAGHELPVCAGHKNRVTALAFAPDGRTLASGSMDYTVKVWDTQTGTCLADLPVPDQPPAALAFSPDSSVVAAGSANGAVQAWEVRTGKPLIQDTSTMSYVSDIAFAPSGKVVIASGAFVLGWLVETGKFAGRMPGGQDSEPGVTAYALPLGMLDFAPVTVDLGPLRPPPEPRR